VKLRKAFPHNPTISPDANHGNLPMRLISPRKFPGIGKISGSIDSAHFTGEKLFILDKESSHLERGPGIDGTCGMRIVDSPLTPLLSLPLPPSRDAKDRAGLLGHDRRRSLRNASRECISAPRNRVRPIRSHLVNPDPLWIPACTLNTSSKRLKNRNIMVTWLTSSWLIALTS